MELTISDATNNTEIRRAVIEDVSFERGRLECMALNQRAAKEVEANIFNDMTVRYEYFIYGIIPNDAKRQIIELRYSYSDTIEGRLDEDAYQNLTEKGVDRFVQLRFQKSAVELGITSGDAWGNTVKYVVYCYNCIFLGLMSIPLGLVLISLLNYWDIYWIRKLALITLLGSMVSCFVALIFALRQPSYNYQVWGFRYLEPPLKHRARAIKLSWWNFGRRKSKN